MLPALATVDDLATRLGQAIGVDDTMQAEWLLSYASTLVRAHTNSWVDDGDELVDPLPDAVTLVTVEMVARAVTNPAGSVSSTEVAGPFQRTVSFGDEAAQRIYLTASDRAMLAPLTSTGGLSTISLTRGVVEMPTGGPCALDRGPIS